VISKATKENASEKPAASANREHETDGGRLQPAAAPSTMTAATTATIATTSLAAMRENPDPKETPGLDGTNHHATRLTAGAAWYAQNPAATAMCRRRRRVAMTQPRVIVIPSDMKKAGRPQCNPS
jgi:hypothetical protein